MKAVCAEIKAVFSIRPKLAFFSIRSLRESFGFPSRSLENQVAQCECATAKLHHCNANTGIILCMCPANEREHYIVMLSVIGWTHTQNDLCNICIEWNENINTLSPEQNGWLFANNIFKCIFLNENRNIFIEILLKFVPGGSINKSALAQVMAWCRLGNKPLPELMLAKPSDTI